MREAVLLGFIILVLVLVFMSGWNNINGRTRIEGVSPVYEKQEISSHHEVRSYL